ncbi:hypothetical protein CGRA01v4_13244 [Colletotrichum graminicola]|nr:hypothetical protein CGRA01v4_13244 [Colletotrichum graminicola]
MFGRQQRTQFSKRSSSGCSWPESDSDDDIVIRPCASDEKADASVTMTEYVPSSTAVGMEQPTSSRPSLTGRRSSAEDAKLEALWECMLELQQKYHCYNSTRMEIAADSEDAMGMMRPPSTAWTCSTTPSSLSPRRAGRSSASSSLQTLTPVRSRKSGSSGSTARVVALAICSLSFPAMRRAPMALVRMIPLFVRNNKSFWFF